MTGKTAKRKSPQVHLALMVSFCAVLAGCETSGQHASSSSKPPRQMSGQPQLAAPGAAVAQLQLPATPAETLYPVTVAYQPAVDPVLAAEAVDPAQVPGAVPVPRPSPVALAQAQAAQAGAAIAALQSPAGATVAGQSGTGIPAEQTQAIAASTIPASPLAAKGARPGTPVAVASTAGIPTSVLLNDQSAAIQTAVPRQRAAALGYAAPGAQNAALAAIDGNASSLSNTASVRMDPTGADRDQIDNLIARYSAEYGVPEKLVHRVVHRESRYNPTAHNRRGPYFGLMQISYPTAKSMGYQGPASGLLDAETNLRYAIKYLRGAYLVADTNHDNAVRLYARGYYFDAKRKGMLSVLEK